MLPSSWFLGLNPSDKALQRRYYSIELRHQDKVGFLRCSPLWELCNEFISSCLYRQYWSNKTEDEDQDMEWEKALKEKRELWLMWPILFVVLFLILWDFSPWSEVHVCRNNTSLIKSSCLSLHIKSFLANSKICLEKKNQVGKSTIPCFTHMPLTVYVWLVEIGGYFCTLNCLCSVCYVTFQQLESKCAVS